MITMKEIWKPVIGWPRYEVSSLGRIKSLPDERFERGPHGMRLYKRRGYLLRAAVMRKNGKAMRETVSLHDNGKKFRAMVHHIVLNAFVGPRPKGTEACHNDGNPLNNKITNLRWDTRASNISDQFRHFVKRHGGSPTPFRKASGRPLVNALMCGWCALI